MKLSQEYIRRLLTEKIAGTISSEEEWLLDQELQSNPEAQAEWEAMCRIMETEEAGEFQQNLDAGRSWNLVAGAILEGRSRGFGRAVLVRRLAIAAAILAGVMVGGWYLLLRQEAARPHIVKQENSGTAQADSLGAVVGLYIENGQKFNLTDSVNRVIDLGDAAVNTSANTLQLQQSQSDHIQWSTVTVPARLDYRIVLADGSEVWLNSSSSIRFPLRFPDSLREVFVEGEAFFKIAQNSRQPFIVHSKNADVQVLGTSFNLNSYHPEQSVVSLVEGAVKARAKQEKTETLLKPGLEAVLHSARSARVRSFKANNTLAWMKGIYYFHNTPLTEINEQLQRWFGITIVFSDPSLGNIAVTGAIEKNQPLTDFLNNLQTSAGLTAEIRDRELHISR